MSTRPPQRGFSLIELIVVIGIIAVLAAIIFPVFAAVRERARRVRCESNMRQVGQALLIYAEDSSGYLPSFSQSHPSWAAPPADRLNPQPGVVVTWDLSIQPQLKSTEVLLCPDNPFARGVRSYAVTAYTQKSPVPFTYLGERVENIPNRTGTVLLFEKGMNPLGAWGDAMGENVRQSHGTNDPPPFGPDADYSAAPFHLKGKNFLFLDGHVAWYKEETGPFLNPPGTAIAGRETGACHVPDRPPVGDWPDKQ